jgi:hypothetical protein
LIEVSDIHGRLGFLRITTKRALSILGVRAVSALTPVFLRP